MVSLGKMMKIEFMDGVKWKDIGYWDGSKFEPIIEEPPPILVMFTEAFITAAGVMEALLPDVAIRGKSMGVPTHVSFSGRTFEVHAISTLEYVSTLDLPGPKLWAEMGGLPMPIAESIPHLRLDITGEDAVRFRQAVELHQAVEFKKSQKGQETQWGSLFTGTATVEPSHQTRAMSLMDKIPALRERADCPCTCIISQARYPVEDCIMHLNDSHHPNMVSNVEGWEPWTREQIADWVDSLPFDFTVQPTPTRERGSRAEFEALGGYMKVDSASIAIMLAKIQEAIDDGLIQKMADQMSTMIVNKEEDK